MKRGRHQTRDDTVYLKYREWYLANKERILADAKDDRIRENMLAREKRLESKRQLARIQQGRPPSRIDTKKNEAKTFVRKQKESEPCSDCHIYYPYYVMDFDHVRGRKRWDVSEMTSKGKSLGAIEKEIRKCDLVCANCHRIRTYTRSTLVN